MKVVRRPKRLSAERIDAFGCGGKLLLAQTTELIEGNQPEEPLKLYGP